LLAVSIPASVSAAPANVSTDGTYWKDAAGGTLKCQGGNVTKFGSDYYWICSDLRDDGSGTWNGWNGVYVYKSSDVTTWTYQNTILAPSRDGAPSNTSWVGRPSLLFNSISGKYVAIFESDGGVSAATSPNLSGNYTWHGRIANTSGYTPAEINDISVVTDGGHSYVIGNNDKVSGSRMTGLWQLRDSDFLAIVAKSYEDGPQSHEAHHITKVGSTYYWFGSDMNGWNSTKTSYRTSNSLLDGWSGWSTVPTTPSTTTSFDTQFDFVIPVVGSSTTSYIYAGDRYSQFTGSGPGYNAWFPLTFPNGIPTIEGVKDWTIDAVTGAIETSARTNLIANPGFESGLSNWRAEGPVQAWVTTSQQSSGSNSANVWSTSPYTSWLESAPAANVTAASYTASAKVYSGGTFNDAKIQIYSGTTLLAQGAIGSGSGWRTVTVPATAVAAGTNLKVGFWLDGQADSWIYIDDVTLTRQ